MTDCNHKYTFKQEDQVVKIENGEMKTLMICPNCKKEVFYVWKLINTIEVPNFNEKMKIGS